MFALLITGALASPAALPPANNLQIRSGRNINSLNMFENGLPCRVKTPNLS